MFCFFKHFFSWIMVLGVILCSSSPCVCFSYMWILSSSFIFILSVTLYRVVRLYLYYTIYYIERNGNNIPLRSKNPENMFWRRYIIYSSSPPLLLLGFSHRRLYFERAMSKNVDKLFQSGHMQPSPRVCHRLLSIII